MSVHRTAWTVSERQPDGEAKAPVRGAPESVRPVFFLRLDMLVASPSFVADCPVLFSFSGKLTKVACVDNNYPSFDGTVSLADTRALPKG